MFFSNVLDIFVELISIHTNVGKHRPSIVQCIVLGFFTLFKRLPDTELHGLGSQVQSLNSSCVALCLGEGVPALRPYYL